jgi:hypothetical protein
MGSFYNIVNVLHSTLVLLFVVTTGLFLAVSVIRRGRLRKVRLSWGDGPLFGLPLVPTVFLLVVVALIGIELATDESVATLGWLVLSGYLTGGIFWYIGAVLATSVVVTDWGVSRRRRGKTEAIPWHKVTDYLANDQGRMTTYVFFRVDDRGRKQRFEISVPAARQTQFREVVESKLDARFNYYVRRPAGSRALKQ